MAMEALEISIRVLRLIAGVEPFSKWLSKLADERGKQIIDSRLSRLRTGNFGATRSVGEGVHELKINFGPGYRIYFARLSQRAVLIITGGTKSTQNEDIKAAKAHWKEYKERQRGKLNDS